MPYVLSFYDYTGEAVRPWAEAGYHGICYDIQHPTTKRVERLPSGGKIEYVHADLHDPTTWDTLAIQWRPAGRSVAMIFGFPVCTDLAVSGAKHFERKRQADPDFQIKAANHAKRIALFAHQIGDRPYMVENPVSVLSTLWRKPDHSFNPCDFGGYLPEDDQHPRWPEVIPARDAYTKKTCLWTGNGFVMPEGDPVEPIQVSYQKADGTVTTGSPQFGKLGGKSAKTKNIRSATPRGFARAVYLANRNPSLDASITSGYPRLAAE